MDRSLIANRIKQERERCGLTQAQVAKHMQWDASGHTIVTEIEAGRRELKAWELHKLAQLFHRNLEDFFSENSATQPFILWRNKPDKKAPIKERQFLQRCEEYQFLEELLGAKLPIKRQLAKFELDLNKASFEWAYEIAESIRNEFNLGDYPATTLTKILEESYGVRFMALPLGEDGSAACTYFDFGPAILINSDDVIWRQSFSIAHDLFHLLTWNDNLFSQIQENPELDKRNEQLANAFAAGLLLPESPVRQQFRRLRDSESQLFGPIIAIAREYHVSTSALVYRLKSLKLLTDHETTEILSDESFRQLDKKSFKKTEKSNQVETDRFVRLAFLAYQFHKISRSRLARLLNVSLISLESFLNANGLSEINNEKIQIDHP